ncbi:MAG: 4Fe-4S binding protein [Bilophila wadsworthia]
MVLFVCFWERLKPGVFSVCRQTFPAADPLAGTAIPLVTRTIIPALFPAVFTILLAILAGRIFCGWLCPMGATLDILEVLLAASWEGEKAVSATFRPLCREASNTLCWP